MSQNKEMEEGVKAYMTDKSDKQWKKKSTKSDGR